MHTALAGKVAKCVGGREGGRGRERAKHKWQVMTKGELENERVVGEVLRDVYEIGIACICACCGLCHVVGQVR